MKQIISTIEVKTKSSNRPKDRCNAFTRHANIYLHHCMDTKNQKLNCLVNSTIDADSMNLNGQLK